MASRFSKASIFYLGISFAVISPFVFSQRNETLKFRSSDIQKTAAQLTGDSLTWPIILSVADFQAESSNFTISKVGMKTVQTYSSLHSRVRRAKMTIEKLIRAGARVFAANILEETSRSLKHYDAAVYAGDIRSAQSEGENFIQLVGKLADEVALRRNESIDAILNEKTGEVDKRKGFLGDWKGAARGDLFSQADGIRTGELSFAQLAFTDGAEIVIDPKSTVIIRASQMDKLDKSVKRDIALMSGSLLTKLSASAKDRNDFTFQAGSSQSVIKSGRFWASNSLTREVKLSNYDGTVDLTANNVQITIESNFGTVVKKDQSPLKPVPLLSPPQLSWPRLDSVIYGPKLLLEWIAVSGAASYQIEICTHDDFSSDIERIIHRKNSFMLANIPFSQIYVRMQSIDQLGLRGMDSPIYRIMRNQDTQPPPIYIDGWETDRRYTIKTIYEIEGKTEPGAGLTANGISQKLNSDGSFLVRTKVQPPEQLVSLLARDKSSNVSRRTLSIVTMDTNRIAAIAWNSRLDGNVLYLTGEQISASGTAYPHMRVQLTNGNATVSALTDISGAWAASLPVERGGVLTISFESLDDQQRAFSRQYLVR